MPIYENEHFSLGHFCAGCPRASTAHKGCPQLDIGVEPSKLATVNSGDTVGNGLLDKPIIVRYVESER